MRVCMHGCVCVCMHAWVCVYRACEIIAECSVFNMGITNRDNLFPIFYIGLLIN